MTFLNFLCLVLIVLPGTHSDNTTLTDPLTAQLQFLLNEEKDLRRNLETRVQRLRNEVQAINNVLGSIHLKINKLFRYCSHPAFIQRHSAINYVTCFMLI